MKRSVFTATVLSFFMFKLCCCRPQPHKYHRCDWKYHGKHYNISSLGNKDHSPRFNVSGKEYPGYYYLYNPCWPLHLGTGCDKHASICKKANVGIYSDLGDHKTMKYERSKGGGIQLVYKSSAIGISQTSVVELVCNQSEEKGKLTITQENNPYHFRLTHKCCCPDGCLLESTLSSPLPDGPDETVLYVGVGCGAGALVLVIAFTVYIRKSWRRLPGMVPLINEGRPRGHQPYNIANVVPIIPEDQVGNPVLDSGEAARNLYGACGH